MENIGKRIKKLRISYGYSQQDLANKIGVSKAAISAYENNLRNPSNEILISISTIFKVSTDFLLGKNSNKIIDAENLNDDDYILILKLVESLGNK